MKRTTRDQISICGHYVEAAKLAAKARAATILAGFEDMLPRFYRADDSEAWTRFWKEATGIRVRAEQECYEAMKRCGLPKSLAPRIEFEAYYSLRDKNSRGAKAWIRRRATARVAALEAAAIKAVSDAVLPIIAALHDGLSVEEAQARLDALPAVDSAMPAFSAKQIEAMVHDAGVLKLRRGDEEASD